MKYLLKYLLTIPALLPLWSLAQDTPVVTFAEDGYTLEIPYFTYEGNAYSVELKSTGNPNQLNFSVNPSTLKSAQAGNGAVVIKPQDGACTSTAKAAYLSCAAEVEEEYFIGVGNCFNDDDELCSEDLMEEMAEAEDTCDEQLTARMQVCLAIGEDPYNPDMDPANFMSKAQIIANPNPWFPLVPGNEWVYEADDETITVTVSDDTREILGITAIVVRDVVTDEDDELVEDTDDWFAQDLAGNLWYMGEIARNYEDGRLTDLDGSWEAGLDGAKAGILIRNQPIIDETFRQEFLLGEAEDMGMTVSVTADEESEEAGVSCNSSCLQTLEFTPIEPDAMEYKYYYPGIGKILIIDLESGDREELVSYDLQ